MKKRSSVLSPTFPLNEVELRDRCLHAKMGHPLTWLSLLAAAGAPWFLPLPGEVCAWITLASLAAVGTALVSYWKNNGEGLRKTIVKEMIAESNAVQDRRLNSIIGGFRSRGLGHYGEVLSAILKLKKKIESRVHPRGIVTGGSEQTEKSVDWLCDEICGELEKAAGLDRKLGGILISGNLEQLEAFQAEKTATLSGIADAHTALEKSLSLLMKLENPALLRSDTDQKESRGESGLRAAIESLEAETGMMVRINDRLEVEMG